VIELGAGTSLATIRRMSERTGWPLIRINPREPQVPASRHTGLQMGALAALNGIRAALEGMGLFAG
jgi:hypothetical protein